MPLNFNIKYYSQLPCKVSRIKNNKSIRWSATYLKKLFEVSRTQRDELKWEEQLFSNNLSPEENDSESVPHFERDNVTQIYNLTL